MVTFTEGMLNVKDFDFVLEIEKQPPEVFCEKGVLRNFTKFTGKYLY